MRATDFVVSESRAQEYEMGFKPNRVNLQRETENIQPNYVQEEPGAKVEEINFTLGSREGEYRKKYEKLVIKNEELKEALQQERKQRQNEIIQRDS